MNIKKNYKPLFSGIVLGMLLLACATTQPPSWGSLEEGIKLSYRSEPGTLLQYVNTYEAMTTTEREGNSFDNEMHKNYRFHITTEKIDSLLHFVLTVDSLAQTLISTAGENAFDFGEIEGKRARLTITPAGELRDITGIDSIPRATLPGMPIQSGGTGNNAAQLNPGFFPVPDRTIMIGDAWSETRDDTLNNNETTGNFQRESIYHRDIRYNVIGTEKKMGLDCVHLQVITDVESSTNGNYGETTISGENTGEEKHDIWFAYQECILVEYISERFSEGTQAYSGQMNMTIPMTSDSKVTLKLIQWVKNK